MHPDNKSLKNLRRLCQTGIVLALIPLSLSIIDTIIKYHDSTSDASNSIWADGVVFLCQVFLFLQIEKRKTWAVKSLITWLAVDVYNVEMFLVFFSRSQEFPFASAQFPILMPVCSWIFFIFKVGFCGYLFHPKMKALFSHPPTKTYVWAAAAAIFLTPVLGHAALYAMISLRPDWALSKLGWVLDNKKKGETLMERALPDWVYVFGATHGPGFRLVTCIDILSFHHFGLFYMEPGSKMSIEDMLTAMNKSALIPWNSQPVEYPLKTTIKLWKKLAPEDKKMQANVIEFVVKDYKGIKLDLKKKNKRIVLIALAKRYNSRIVEMFLHDFIGVPFFTAKQEKPVSTL